MDGQAELGWPASVSNYHEQLVVACGLVLLLCVVGCCVVWDTSLGKPSVCQRNPETVVD
jgi:hypothetical protein